jgi:hypothetical protein
MTDFRFSGHALGIFAAIAMLAACSGSQGQTGEIPQGAAAAGVRTAPTSGDCPALSGGTGILPDGDFSQATDPRDGYTTYGRGVVFAPSWIVSKRNIDFNGSTYVDVDGLCSVDLDGHYAVGGIRTDTFSLRNGARYTLSFQLSANYGCPPTVKTMKVEIGREFTTYTWNTAQGEQGDYLSETWQFKGTKGPLTLTLVSQDPKGSSCGALVAGMAITKN